MGRYFKDATCLNCNIPFKARVDNIKIGKGIFCSRKCSARHRVERIKTYKNCLHCEKLFYARPTKVTCCSHDCSNKHYKQNLDDDREKVMVNKKMSVFCTGLIKRCLLAKTDKLKSMLGYSPIELRIHLEKFFVEGMHWGNYGMKGGITWNIDHSRPISSFPPNTGIEVINSLENLRPMWSSENFKKNSKY